MITTTIRERDGQHTDFLRAAVQLLERLATESRQHIDATAAHRSLLDAIDAWPGAEASRWWKWLLEAGSGLGLHLRPLEATVQQALDLVRFGAVVATWLPGEEPVGVLLTQSGGGKLQILLADEQEQQASISRRELMRRLDAARATEPLAWVMIEPVVLRAAGPGGPKARAETLYEKVQMLLRPEWPDIWVVLVYALFVGLLALASPIAVEALVSTVAFGQFLQPIVILALVLFVFLAFAAAIRAVQNYVTEIIQRRLFARVAGELAWRLPRVHQDAYDHAYGPELVNRFFDVVTVQKTAASLLLEGVTLVLGTMIGMAVLAFYHPWLLGFDLLLLGLIAFSMIVLGRGAVVTSIKESKSKYAIAKWLEELARCSVTFKSDGGPALAAERTDHLIGNYITARGQHFRILMRQIAFALFLEALASTVLLGLGGWLVIRGQLTLGQLVAAEIIVAVIVGAFAKLGKHMDSYYDLMAAVDKLSQLFDLPLEQQQGLMHIPALGAATVRVSGLSFHYPSRDPLLQNLHLHLHAEEFVALGGPPGSGKSTLLDLLYGLRDPDAGHIELDRTDLRDLRRDVLRQHVALVRHVEIFHGTIAENVHLHRPEIMTADVRDALERVGLLEEVLAYPEGLQTQLESSGQPLTGSQARRLMLARAIAGRPRLLLIDELLDSLSDNEIDPILTQLRSIASCTFLVVSGRQQVLERADRVVLFPPGSVSLVQATVER